MKKLISFTVLVAFAGVAGNVMAADAAAGKTKSAICAGCHGVDGNSAVPNFPKLAGQDAQYLAKQLAVAMDKKLLHFDMSQFSRGNSAATQLFGSSKGYVGSDTYGKLTAALRDMPDSVVLLDEFEKAHPDVHKNFLTAWNDGFVTEARFVYEQPDQYDDFWA